jgi:hypothetical protein
MNTIALIILKCAAGSLSHNDKSIPKVFAYDLLSAIHCSPEMSGLNENLVERLDKVYFCVQCKAVFLFRSDVIDHEEISGHQDAQTFPLN